MVSTENGTIVETHDKDVVSEGNESISIYDHWVALPIMGQKPKPRYEVLCFNDISYISRSPPFIPSVGEG